MAGHGETSKEAVGVFNDAETLQAAIDDLLSAGFDRAELSLLASESAVEQKLGHVYDRVEDLEDDAGAPRQAYVSKESLGDAEGGLIGGLLYVGAVAAAGAVVASGGTLAAAIGSAALAGGASGAVGAILAQWLDRHHADYLARQLDHGGLLLWVRTRDAAHEARAADILSRHSAHDVHLHALPA
ncbi:MAG: general stress protein [Alphaproteobacteria bacterium]|nr:general stress protein [Alphaproteobacteria bacterium]MDX5368263.1 general stress protein [Alphaproteobacteria bacterium]MDX5463071.1 general stress protein [Alphaproteobacteria bacterium]